MTKHNYKEQVVYYVRKKIWRNVVDGIGNAVPPNIWDMAVRSVFDPVWNPVERVKVPVLDCAERRIAAMPD